MNDKLAQIYKDAATIATAAYAESRIPLGEFDYPCVYRMALAMLLDTEAGIDGDLVGLTDYVNLAPEMTVSPEDVAPLAKANAALAATPNPAVGNE